MIVISELSIDDIPELTSMAAKTYAETFKPLLPDEDIAQTIKETRSEDCFRKNYETDSFLIAKDGAALIGYIQISGLKYQVIDFQTHENDQSINSLYIDKDYQRQGLGKRLMDAAFEHKHLKNLNRVFIDVWEKNEKAVSFYLKYGFKEVGKCSFSVDGTIVGYDLVLMKEI